MKLIKITNEELDTFASSQEQSQFLESAAWKDFQGARAFGLEENGKLLFAFTLIKKVLPLGRSYYYSPRINLGVLNDEQTKQLIIELQKIAQEENAIFWRIEPSNQLKIKNEKLRIIKTFDVQASKTNILDISKSADELLASMHQKTRYNIRLAEKKGVVVRQGSEVDFERFWQIMQETKDRDGFRLHSKEYYRRMLAIPFIELLVAEANGEMIAANIVSYYGDMASYIHGSSSDRQRNLMAPYLLQWTAIKRAKERGLKHYDFNGIDEQKWPGVTRFKHGFGGEDVLYPGAFDVVFCSAAYRSYSLLRTLRRLVGKILGK